jgi:hypothetical protein
MDLTEQTFRGRVYRRILGKTSKSERIVNAFTTEDGRDLVLRQEGKDAFVDRDLEALEGKTITATGTIHSYVFIVSTFTLL